MRLSYRSEWPGDEAEIARVVAAAFEDHPHSDGSEPAIVARLRESSETRIALVACDPAIVGYIVFSPVEIGDGSPGWFGLGPLAVAPTWQHRGIGRELVSAGLDILRFLGEAGCVVLGDPAYYSRFGFVADPALTYPGPPPEYFQSLVLAGPPASGIVRYAKAFG